MDQKPPVRTGLAFGLGIVLMLSVLDIGLGILIVSAPLSPLSILRALLIVANLAVIGRLLINLANLSKAVYRLDRNELTIRWGRSTCSIPLEMIEKIQPAVGLGKVEKFRGIRWPGLWNGEGHLETVGQTRFFASAPLDRQLVIQSSAGNLSISPDNIDRFLALFEKQRILGPNQEVAPSIKLAPDIKIAHADPWGYYLLATGAFFNLLLYFYLSIRISRLPETLPLHFAPGGVIDRSGPPIQLLAMVGVGTILWVVNGLLGWIVIRRFNERVIGYVLWGIAAGLQILLFWVLFGLMGR